MLGTRSAEPSSTTNRRKSSACSTCIRALTDVKDDYYPAPLARRADRINALVYPDDIQQRVSTRTGFATPRPLRGRRFRPRVCGPRQSSGGWREPLSGRQRHDRSGLRLLNAGAFRRRLCRPFQMQTWPGSTDYSEPIELSARSLPGGGRGRTRENGSHQAEYYGSHNRSNPSGSVPLGPQLDFSAAA